VSQSKIESAKRILTDLGLPRAQLNDRSALTLLALIDLKQDGDWRSAAKPLIGITPIMDWVREHYGRDYKPNTRETFRRQTMHQFIQAGLVQYNPDEPNRPVNSPQAVYQITPEAFELIRMFGTSRWKRGLERHLELWKTLKGKYARERDMSRVPIQLSNGASIYLSPGEHSKLIRSILEEFAPRFAPNSTLVYIGDTEDKSGYLDEALLFNLGVKVERHGKMPDVVLHFTDRNWLLLIESVTSHGPVDAKRHEELRQLFLGSKAGLVFVTAFPSRRILARYFSHIAWESEVWVADAPTHLIHFNGTRFLGPYPT
jgi:hypothetical protein